MNKDLHEISEMVFACRTISELANTEFRLTNEYPELRDDIYDYARWQYVNIKDRERAEAEINGGKHNG